MRLRAKVIDACEDTWSEEALDQLADKLPGVKVRDRVGSTLDLDKRGSDEDTDPIIGEVVSCVRIGREVIATLEVEGEDLGHVVGVAGWAEQDGDLIVSVSSVSSLGLDDDPKTCSWGEIIG